MRPVIGRRTIIASLGMSFLALASGAAAAFETRHAGHRHHRRTEAETDNTGPTRSGEIIGIASYYGAGESTRTASGERFNPQAMTAAHRTLPLGSSVKVTNLANGREVVVRINDRGPFSRGRVIDVSRGAAEALGFVSRGLAKVSIITV
jgi:rare lipoprotein A